MFRSIDVHSENVKLTLNKEEQIKTSIGGIFTILTGLLIIICTYLIGNDIIYRQKPISYNESPVSAKRSNITLKFTNYPITYNLENRSGNIEPNASFYYVELIYYKTIQMEDGTRKVSSVNLPITKCQDEIPKDNNYINYLKINNKDALFKSYCIDNQNINLFGYWDENEVAFLSINVFICDYDKTPEKCALKQEIEEHITQTAPVLSLNTIEGTFSINNFNNPLISFIKKNYKFLYLQASKVVNYMIMDNNLITDSGFFSGSLESKNYYSIYEEQTDFYPIPKTNKRLITFALFSSNKTKIIHRSYIKIAELVESLGGILNLILVCFQFINS